MNMTKLKQHKLKLAFLLGASIVIGLIIPLFSARIHGYIDGRRGHDGFENPYQPGGLYNSEREWRQGYFRGKQDREDGVTRGPWHE